MFENSNSVKDKDTDNLATTPEELITKEPEMFESTNLEDDLEIPAFLRRQKN